MTVLFASGYLTGLRQLRAGNARGARETLRRVLSDDPTHEGAGRNLIRAGVALRDWTLVIGECAVALAQTPDSAELHYHHGTALSAQGCVDEAMGALRRAIGCDPNHAAAHVNLGNLFMDRDDPAAAEMWCREAQRLDPDLIEARISLGFILTFAGRLTEAIGVLREAVQRAPDHVQAHWNLAAAALVAGDLETGFREYEWRKRHDRFRRDFIDPPGPIWDGGAISGKTILVHAEQGLGDTIQFARYLPLIGQRGGVPILACDEALVPLLRSMPNARIVSKADSLPAYDAWIDQMSLPRVFATTLDTIPFAGGYLPMVERLCRTGIGLAWRGNPLHENDRRRTPPSEAFAPLLRHIGAGCVNLVPEAALAGTRLPERNLTDYAATAAVIASLELVIAVDTSVAHLAGAMGREVWILLPFAPDWRWLTRRSDSPWYRSARLFRQTAPGDWSGVMADVMAALNQRAKERGGISV